MVRALNKFRMAVYVEAVVPVGRLIGAVTVWLTAPSVENFLLVWAAVDLIEAACYWAMARRLAPESVRLSYLKDTRMALQENPGLWRFFLVTFAGSTIDALTKNGPLLIVGGVVGTRAAGLYRLASQLSPGAQQVFDHVGPVRSMPKSRGCGWRPACRSSGGWRCRPA